EPGGRKSRWPCWTPCSGGDHHPPRSPAAVAARIGRGRRHRGGGAGGRRPARAAGARARRRDRRRPQPQGAAAAAGGRGRAGPRSSGIVTFTGRPLDVPLLESRYRLRRERFPLECAVHLDLLHPARRLWTMRLESCRLQSLEVALLGLRRHGDVPGEEIPQIWFDYLRRRDGRALVKVLEHNRLDVVSLAALSGLACRWVEDGWAEDPRDVYSLARVLERA